MTQRLLEPDQVQLALREIAAARGHLQLASDTLTAFGAAEAVEEAPGLAKTLVNADIRRQLYLQHNPEYRACPTQLINP